MAVCERAIRRIMNEFLDEKFEKLIAPIVQSLDFIGKEYEDLKKKVTVLEETNKNLDQKNSNLSRQVAGLTNELRQCKNEQDEQEQYIRRECAEIRGAPARRGENTNEIVQKVGALMDLDIDDSEISISHRLPSRTSNRSDSDRASPPIIVRFVRRVVRDQFLHGRSKLKNFTTKDIDLGRICDNKIFIQESLTSRKKALFKTCLELKKRNNFKFIWTHHGTIFLRKSESATAMKVSYQCDLDKIDQPHSPDFEFSRRSYAEAVSSPNLQSATQRPG